MSSIFIIARNTLRQAMRERLFFNVAVFGFGMLLFSMVVADITFGRSDRVVRSIGLSGVTLAVDLMALLLSVSLIHQEIDRKTLFVVLTRPVQRWKYVIGRYLGLMTSLSIALIGFSIVFLLVLSMVRGTPSRGDVFALAAILPESAILAGFGLMLSCFSTPMLSTGLGLGFWVAAASTDDLIGLTKKAEEPTKLVVELLYYLLPNFARLDFRTSVIHQHAVALSDFAISIGYGVVYAACLVLLATAILSRREML